jgi:hypothetical protein
MIIHQLPVGQQLSVHGTHAERPGIFALLFELPDFVEHTERSTVCAFCPAFKLTKDQMQAITGWVNVAVCKQKNRWQNYDSWSVEKPRQ